MWPARNREVLMLSFMGHRAVTRALQTHSVHISWRWEVWSRIDSPSSNFFQGNNSDPQPTWWHWWKHCSLHSKLQHLLSSPMLYVCLPFPVDSASASCSRMLPAMGTPTHCWWVAQAQLCSHSFLIPLPATPPHWFCTQSSVWSLRFFSSAVASHVLSCSPSSSQQQKGLVSPPHSWRLPTAGSGFLSNLSPAELGLLALSAVGQMKRWLLANFLDKHHLAPAAPLGWNWVQLSYQLLQMIPLFFKKSQKKKDNNNWPYLVLIWC